MYKRIIYWCVGVQTFNSLWFDKSKFVFFSFLVHVQQVYYALTFRLFVKVYVQRLFI